MKEWLKDMVNRIKADLARAHHSMTIWFNALVGIVALNLPGVIAFVPQLEEYVDAPTYKTWMVVLLVGNSLLRFKTTKALADK
jgi:hypothetical protein